MRPYLRLATAGFAVLMLTSLGGCLQQGDSDAAREEAEVVAVNGMRQLAEALADTEGGTLSSIEMSIASPGRGGDENDTSLTARLDWALSGASRRHAVLAEGADRHETTIWCTSGFVYYEWDGAVYQERTIRDPARGDPCRFDGIPQARHLLAPFTPDGADALPVPEVYLNDDEVTAVFHLGDGERLVVQHDRHGLVRHVHGGDPDTTFDAYVTYGLRQPFELPEPTERIPAHVETARVHEADPDRHVYEVLVSWHAPELNEIEARWVARDPADGADVVLLAFPLDSTGPAGGRFHFDDVDGDGRVTAGDRYTFAPPVEDAGGMVLRELVLFDNWAGEEVNAPVPGVMAPLVALGLVAWVAVARRRGL